MAGTVKGTNLDDKTNHPDAPAYDSTLTTYIWSEDWNDLAATVNYMYNGQFDNTSYFPQIIFTGSGSTSGLKFDIGSDQYLIVVDTATQDLVMTKVGTGIFEMQIRDNEVEVYKMISSTGFETPSSTALTMTAADSMIKHNGLVLYDTGVATSSGSGHLLIGTTGTNETDFRIWMAPRKSDDSGWDFTKEFGWDTSNNRWYAESDFLIGGDLRIGSPDIGIFYSGSNTYFESTTGHIYVDVLDSTKNMYIRTYKKLAIHDKGDGDKEKFRFDVGNSEMQIGMSSTYIRSLFYGDSDVYLDQSSRTTRGIRLIKNTGSTSSDLTYLDIGYKTDLSSWAIYQWTAGSGTVQPMKILTTSGGTLKGMSMDSSGNITTDGQMTFEYGGTTYGGSSIATLNLGKQGSAAGSIKLRGNMSDTSAYGQIQQTTYNLHLDTWYSTSSRVYIGYYGGGWWLGDGSGGYHLYANEGGNVVLDSWIRVLNNQGLYAQNAGEHINMDLDNATAEFHVRNTSNQNVFTVTGNALSDMVTLNSSNVGMGADVLPNTHNTYKLGSYSYRYTYLYAGYGLFYAVSGVGRALFAGGDSTASTEGVANIVNTNTTDTDNTVLRVTMNKATTAGTTNKWILFVRDGVVRGQIDSEVRYSTFTGGHNGAIDPSYNASDLKQGMILRSTGNFTKKPTISDALPDIAPTTTMKSPDVMGVYNSYNRGHTPTELNNHSLCDRCGNHYTDGTMCNLYHGDFPWDTDVVEYNSIGEGMILVTNKYGAVTLGDYICSSDITGIGMLQGCNVLHNYTVAKCTETVDWNNVPVDPDLGIKIKMVSCTYHCG